MCDDRHEDGVRDKVDTRRRSQEHSLLSWTKRQKVNQTCCFRRLGHISFIIYFYYFSFYCCSSHEAVSYAFNQ